LIVENSKTSFFTLNPEIERVSDKVHHKMILNGKSYKIPHLNLFMFRTPNDRDLQKLVNESPFTFCEDPIRKCAALSFEMESKIITVKDILKTIIEKIQIILKQKLSKIAPKVIFSIPKIFTSTQRSDSKIIY
jgi:hypothetical protein